MYAAGRTKDANGFLRYAGFYKRKSDLHGRMKLSPKAVANVTKHIGKCLI
jgi:hypothetical protein